MKQVLLVEDDPLIGQTLSLSLPYRGFSVFLADSVARAREAIETHPFDLVILDLQLPDGSGFDLCRILRAGDSLLPILIITARTDEASAVRSLSLGADDHIRKPFGLDELSARMDRLLARRSSREQYLSFRDLVIDLGENRAVLGGQELSLGRKEFGILSLLVQKGGEVVTREEILSLFPNSLETFDRTVDSHLSHLRKKIRAIAGDRLRIHPVYGVGYRLETVPGP